LRYPTRPARPGHSSNVNVRDSVDNLAAPVLGFRASGPPSLLTRPARRPLVELSSRRRGRRGGRAGSAAVTAARVAPRRWKMTTTPGHTGNDQLIRRTALGRALAVLDAFGPRHRLLSLSEIARRADLTLPTTH